MMRVPKSIKKYIEGKNYHVDKIGQSRTSVYIFDEFVLKIGTINQENIREYEMLLWLVDKLEVPKVIHFEKTRNMTYLIMERIDGAPSFTLAYEQAIEIACEGMKKLWKIDTDTFPYPNSKKDALSYIKHNVMHFEKELIQNADPDTYTNESFKNPRELYQWLENNYPHTENTVFSHGDYFLPNILVKNNKIVSFIDFGLAGLYPRERDIAQLVKSLNYNYKKEKRHHELISRHLQVEINWDLVHYFKLYDELI